MNGARLDEWNTKVARNTTTTTHHHTYLWMNEKPSRSNVHCFFPSLFFLLISIIILLFFLLLLVYLACESCCFQLRDGVCGDALHNVIGRDKQYKIADHQVVVYVVVVVIFPRLVDVKTPKYATTTRWKGFLRKKSGITRIRSCFRHFCGEHDLAIMVSHDVNEVLHIHTHSHRGLTVRRKKPWRENLLIHYHASVAYQFRMVWKVNYIFVVPYSSLHWR